MRDGKLVFPVPAKRSIAEAVRLYETTTENLKSIAKQLGLTYNSVGGYIRRNYPDIIRRHEELVKQENSK